MGIKTFFLRRAFWTKDFFHGAPVGKFYKELKICSRDKEFAESIKSKRIQALLDYATSNCKFYYKLVGGGISDFPVVTKSVLIENHDDILVPEDKNPYQPKGVKYFVQRTSGSTGTPFAVEQDVRKRNRRLAELKYFGEIVGFKTHEPLVQLRIWQGRRKSKSQIFWENIYPFDASNLDENHCKELSKILVKKKAVCLRGYASWFDVFAKYLEKHPEDFPNLKVAIAGSEALFDSTRELVQKNLRCEIISQYANEENGILAQERLCANDHRFYINNDGYVFEVLKFNTDEPADYGELGRIVLTDLFNYAFPIIRYENGDTCVLEKDEQSGMIYIAKLFGRRMDLVFDTKGEPVFPMVFYAVLKNCQGISQWQFCQNKETEYTLKLCVTQNFEKGKTDMEIINSLKDVFGQDSVIAIDYVDDIPVLQSGKRKAVMNLMGT